jgi:hypothetical protein
MIVTEAIADDLKTIIPEDYWLSTTFSSSPVLEIAAQE